MFGSSGPDPAEAQELLEAYEPIISVPFRAGHTWYRVFGLLRVRQRSLLIEFQTLENILGLVKSRIRHIEIPISEMASAAFEPHFFRGGELILRALSLKTFQKFPGSLQGVCHLRVARRDRALAEDLVVQLQLRMAEVQLERMEGPIQRLELSPPAFGSPSDPPLLP